MTHLDDSRRRPKDRRDQLVRAALRLFHRHGYPAVSIYDIGRSVGVTGATLYRHFDSKEALLVAAYELSIDRLRTVDDRVDDGRPPRERLDDLLRTELVAAIDDLDLAAIYLRESRHIETKPPRLLEAHRRHVRLWTDLLLELEVGLSREQACFVVFAMSGISGSLLSYRSELRPAALADVLRRVAVAALSNAAGFTHPASAEPPTDNWCTKMSPSRREEILTAAITLMRRRGFEGVGIDAIGEAVGIAGPSVYRHFRSKEDVLVAAFDRAHREIVVRARESVASARTPAQAVRTLVESYVACALQHVDLVSVYLTEVRALPRQRGIAVLQEQQDFVDLWIDAVRRLRRDLDGEEARAIVRAAIGLISVGGQYESPLPGDVVRRTLTGMALGALVDG